MPVFCAIPNATVMIVKKILPFLWGCPKINLYAISTATCGRKGGFQTRPYGIIAGGITISLFLLFLTACTQTTATPQELVKSPTPAVGAAPTNTSSAAPSATPTFEPAPPPRTLVICLAQEPQTLYPPQVSSLVERHVLEAVYDGPVDNRAYQYQPVILSKLPSLADGDAVIERVKVKAGERVLDENGERVTLGLGVRLHPAGCRSNDCSIVYDGSSEIEMDQMRVSFKLLSGLLWSDGAPLTAADSLYAYQLTLDPATPGSKFLVNRTADYEVADAQTVVWRGLPGFLDPGYALNFWSPYPQHVWGQYSAETLLQSTFSAQRPLGYGPYMIEEWVKGQRLVLKKNPNYFRAAEGLPKFDVLIFRFITGGAQAGLSALQAGECDILDQSNALETLGEEIFQLAASGEVQALTAPSGVYWEHLAFNQRPAAELRNQGAFAAWDQDGDGLGPFGDARLRQALAQCIDRSALLQAVWFGKTSPLYSYLSSEHPLFDATAKRWETNPAAAASLLDEIGWRDLNNDGKREALGVSGVPDGTALAFSFAAVGATQQRLSAEAIAQSLKACGAEITLTFLAAEELFAAGPEGLLFGRRFDVAQFAWRTSLSPACSLYLSDQIPGSPSEQDPNGATIYPYGWGGQNLAGYRSAEYDAACQTALGALPGESGYLSLMQRPQQIFAADLPAAPLYLRLRLAAARSDLCGFSMDPTARSELWNLEAFDYGAGCQK